MSFPLLPSPDSRSLAPSISPDSLLFGGEAAAGQPFSCGYMEGVFWPQPKSPLYLKNLSFQNKHQESRRFPSTAAVRIHNSHGLPDKESSLRFSGPKEAQSLLISSENQSAAHGFSNKSKNLLICRAQAAISADCRGSIESGKKRKALGAAVLTLKKIIPLGPMFFQLHHSEGHQGRAGGERQREQRRDYNLLDIVGELANGGGDVIHLRTLAGRFLAALGAELPWAGCDSEDLELLVVLCHGRAMEEHGDLSSILGFSESG
uniref:Uncharacterized protein LOC114912936 n=1 Tax=Elaeis guineensis var. tenera TaxID=51953 RepID=A0A8N4EYG6_ELAGV|nr:uncharacterized protein LOC114912936 [Elaeis guineensis]